jgi:hypothetical protein
MTFCMISTAVKMQGLAYDIYLSNSALNTYVRYSITWKP